MRLPADLSPEAVIDARQQNDHELETWAAEIKVRATRRIGEISKGLEKGAGRPGKIVPPSGRISKADTLKAAGVSTQAASRCEKIAEIPVVSTWADLERGEWRSQVTPTAAVGSCLGWIAAGVPVVMAGDHARAGRYTSRLLYTAARRRWREVRALAAAIAQEAAP